MKFFVTGTDTNVGKTIISSWIALHLNAYYWKPISSSAQNESPDYKIVQNLAQLDDQRIVPCAHSFKTPVSPHLAAAIEDQYIDFDDFVLPNLDPLVIEGAGGVMVPINNDYKIIDIMQKFNIPSIIVARSSLGTINHTCLTIESLKARNIPILGVIMNGEKNYENRQAIEKYGNVKILAEFNILQNVTYESLKKIPLFNIDYIPELIKENI